LAEVQKYYDTYTKFDTRVLALSTDSAKQSARVVNNLNLSATLLCDEDRKVVDLFNLRNPLEHDGIAYPATFIINPDGKIYFYCRSIILKFLEAGLKAGNIHCFLQHQAPHESQFFKIKRLVGQDVEFGQRFQHRIICTASILLTAVLAATVARTQGASETESTSIRPKDADSYKADVAHNPLKPTDTTSPRDTLRSFLTNMTIVIDEWHQRGTILSPASYAAYNRAMSTLDLSTTPDNDSRTIINLRLALLQEILPIYILLIEIIFSPYASFFSSKAARILAGVSGSSMKSTPMASYTALTMAGAGDSWVPSPASLAP
jgi:hypothetical protein